MNESRHVVSFIFNEMTDRIGNVMKKFGALGHKIGIDCQEIKDFADLGVYLSVEDDRGER